MVQIFKFMSQVLVPQDIIIASPPFTILNAEGDRRSSAWRTVNSCFMIDKFLVINIRPIIVGYSFDRRNIQINFIKAKYFHKKIKYFFVITWIYMCI